MQSGPSSVIYELRRNIIRIPKHCLAVKGLLVELLERFASQLNIGRILCPFRLQTINMRTAVVAVLLLGACLVVLAQQPAPQVPQAEPGEFFFV